MKFDVTAVIKEIGEIEKIGEKGFQKRNLILSEQSGEYENLVCVEFFGEKLERPDSHQVGQTVKVSGFVNCNECNGRYFTSLRGSFIQNAGEAPQQAPVTQMGQPQAPVYNQPVAQPVAPQPTFPNPQPASMIPLAQPYNAQQPQAPQQAVPVQQPQMPTTTPVSVVQQPQATQQLFDANGNPVDSDIPF